MTRGHGRRRLEGGGDHDGLQLTHDPDARSA